MVKVPPLGLVALATTLRAGTTMAGSPSVQPQTSAEGMGGPLIAIATVLNAVLPEPSVTCKVKVTVPFGSPDVNVMVWMLLAEVRVPPVTVQKYLLAPSGPLAVQVG